MTEAQMTGRMREFEEYLSGGLEHRKWHYLFIEDEQCEGGQREAVLLFMDAEYDLVRVTYDFEGVVQIHADGNKWCSLRALDLEWLAGMVDEVASAVEAWMEGGEPSIEKSWGKYEGCED